MKNNFKFIKPIGQHLKAIEKREGGLGLLKNKKGMGIGDLYPVMLTICLVAILIAIVLFVLDEFGQQMTNNSLAQNATEDISEDISDFIPWIGIILLVIAAAIVLGILIRNLAGGSGRV